MPNRKQRIIGLAITFGLVALNLVALNVLIAGHSTARLDLTAERQFSISPVTKRILQSLEDDVVIHGYFSQRTHPKLAPLVPSIQDLLEEYRAVSRGRVRVDVIDPGADEQAEEQASARFGVTSTPFRLASKYETGIVNAYFALVVQHGDQYEKYGFEDLIEVEPLADGDVDVRLRNLEYDLTRGIKKVVFGFRSTAELFERVQGPVKLTAIISAAGLPEVFKDVPEAVRGAANELEQKSEGKFVFEELDPTGDQALEQRVYTQFGIQPMSLSLFGGETFYLYAILQSQDRAEQLALTGGTLTQAALREAIEASLRRQTPGFLKTVGIVTPRPELPQELAFQYQMRGMQPPPPRPEFQQVATQLQQEYRVQPVSLEGEARIPADVDVLLVLKPKNLSQRAVFALDQYVMRGGRLILCAGSHETSFSADGIRVAPITTGLNEWLAHLGISVPAELVLDDQNQALPIPEVRNTPIGMLRTWRMAPYPYLVKIDSQGLEGSVIGSGLEAMGVYWANPVVVDSAKTQKFKVAEVLRSSKKSWTSSDLSRVQFVEYELPAQGTQPRPLAVSLEGTFRSFFAGQDPPPAPSAGDETAPAPADVVLESSPETRILVVGNSEFLSDFVAQALGRAEGGFFTENLRFVENAIDWMSLDSDMIAIRSRATVARRLNTIDQAVRVTFETANYVIPPALLLAFGAAHFVRRRRVTPVIAGTPSRPLTPAEAS